MPYKKFPATVQLGDLDGSTGFKIYGEAAGDFSGVAVNGAGDFNHDGVADLFIGARNADPTGTLDTGRGYALWGKWNMGSNGVIELASLTPSTGLYFDTNEAGTYHGFSSGYSTHSPFDFNGDGQCDETGMGGCTYYEAYNYDAEAAYDDGSCAFPEGNCIFDSNGDGGVNITDLLDMLVALGTTCPQ